MTEETSLVTGVYVGIKDGRLFSILYDELGCEYLCERTGDGWEMVAFKNGLGFEAELKERQLSPDPAEVVEGLLSQQGGKGIEL